MRERKELKLSNKRLAIQDKIGRKFWMLRYRKVTITLGLRGGEVDRKRVSFKVE